MTYKGAHAADACASVAHSGGGVRSFQVNGCSSRTVSGHQFDVIGAAEAWPGCPDRFLQSLALYVEGRVEPGAFLRACLEDGLRDTVLIAHEESYEALPHVVRVIYYFVPRAACGSKEAVAQWLSRKSRKEASDVSR